MLSFKFNLNFTKGGSQFRVMLGEHDHCKATSSFVLASAVHKHPKFDISSASVDNDIAILKVKNANDLFFCYICLCKKKLQYSAFSCQKI